MNGEARSLLELIATTVRRRGDLIAALRAHGGRTAGLISARLEAGAPLPVACATIADAPTRALLAGTRGDLADRVLLAVEDLRLRERQRRLRWRHLSYPVAVLAVIIAASVALSLSLSLAPAWSYLLAAAPALIVLILAVILPWCRREHRWLVPFIGSWSAHFDRAGLYRRGALAARWRLSEEELTRYLGDDCAPLAPLLADDRAEDLCRRLAAHHDRTGHRHLMAAMILTVTALIWIAGCVEVAIAAGFHQQQRQLQAELIDGHHGEPGPAPASRHP